MRLIDADALDARIYNDIPIRVFGSVAKMANMREIISQAPTIDAEPVRRGRYIGTEYDGYADGNPVFYEWICSECECVFEDDKPTYKYCPNCGAKMDGDGDGA